MVSSISLIFSARVQNTKASVRLLAQRCLEKEEIIQNPYIQ